MSAHHAAITLCEATAAGVFLIALADRLRIPSIALLLLGGIVLGPEVLGIVHPASLGPGLETVVMIAVAVILFEGGLTLDVVGFRREPRVIVRMLTVGVLITWAGASGAVYLVFDDLSLELSIIAGSLVIVTGPTVVSPLLRRIGVQPRLHHILYWEGVLVDAVGVFVAVLCYEWIAASGDQSVLGPLGRFASRFAIGVGMGLAAGFALGVVLHRRWVSTEHVNIIVLGSALLTLGTANAVLAESGILAVIVAGLLLSLRRPPQLNQLKRFELELTEIAIGLLFVLLAATLDLSHFVADGPQLIVVLLVVVFVLRPLNVLVATWGQGFSWGERAFLSWLAPRGIVAASMASLFALRLRQLGYAEAQHLETFTYAVIGTTVVIQGLTASTLAQLLGLKRAPRATWLLIGDPTLAVTMHRQLNQAGAGSIVIAAGGKARDRDSALAGEDIETIASDPLDPKAIRDPRVTNVEAVLALARDPELNAAICEAWAPVVGAAACYRWTGEGADPAADSPGTPVWQDAPTPHELTAGLDAGTLALEAISVGPPEDAARFGPGLLPLLAVDDHRISVLVGGAALDHDAVIALRRRVPGLYGLIQDALIFDSDRATYASIVEALLALAEKATPGLGADHLADIIDREKTMPTAIGGGVAIPHVYDDQCERSMCFVANVSGGLDALGPDSEPVRLVFLVVSPSGKATEHLRSLAALAHVASDRDLVRVLTRQRIRGRLLTLLRERE